MDKPDELAESYKKQQALIELGNVLWDNNWSWTVSKQEVDFAEINNGSFDVGVATFVNISLHPSQLERQNIGYSHVSHKEKSMAYNLSRKISVVNALQETMCSFGGEIVNKVHLTLQNITNIKSSETTLNTPISSKIENKECRSENRSAQIKTNEPIKPKSPGKSARFAPKTFSENVAGPNNNVLANVNFNMAKVPTVLPAVTPTCVDRIIPAQQISNGRCVANNTNGSFTPTHKTSPTSVVTFNSKTGTLPITTHPKAPPLQQLPSNVVAPIVHDTEKASTSKVTKKTAEELRQERIRRQREKQELFKKQMELKNLNAPTEIPGRSLSTNEISTQDMVLAVENAIVATDVIDNTRTMKRASSYSNVSVSKRKSLEFK